MYNISVTTKRQDQFFDDYLLDKSAASIMIVKSTFFVASFRHYGPLIPQLISNTARFELLTIYQTCAIYVLLPKTLLTDRHAAIFLQDVGITCLTLKGQEALLCNYVRMSVKAKDILLVDHALLIC